MVFIYEENHRCSHFVPSGEAPGTHLKRNHGVPSGFPVTYFPMQKREKISSSTSTEAVSPVMDAICSIA